MRYRKGSSDYDYNMEAFHEMDLYVPMTKPERDGLRNWVKSGYDIDTNPWDYIDELGRPMGYIEAYRNKFGRSSGPWDYWGIPVTEYYWN